MIVPYVSIMKINESMKLLSKDKKPLVYKNVRPSLILLDFIDKKDDLTNVGSSYSAALFQDDRNKIQRILSQQIEKTELFHFLIKKLELAGKLSISEIGDLLRERYNKPWKNDAKKAYGRACASVISYAGLAYLYGEILTMQGEFSGKEKYSLPDAQFNQLMQTVKALHTLGTTDSKEISKKVKINLKKLPSILNVGVALNLVHRFSKSVYGISKLGEELLDPSLSDKEEELKFTEVIIKSPYFKIIENFNNKKITSQDLGNKIKYDLKKEWKKKSARQMGTKFLSLLKQTSLLKKEKKDYIIKIPEETSEKIEDVNKVYIIGKLVGGLESAIEFKNKTKFEEIINKLRELKIFSDDVLTLVSHHFDLFLELKEPSLIEKDIEFLKKKIKERL